MCSGICRITRKSCSKVLSLLLFQAVNLSRCISTLGAKKSPQAEIYKKKTSRPRFFILSVPFCHNASLKRISNGQIKLYVDYFMSGSKLIINNFMPATKTINRNFIFRRFWHASLVLFIYPFICVCYEAISLPFLATITFWFRRHVHKPKFLLI